MGLLLVAIAFRFEPGDPHAAVFEGRQHSRGAGVQVGGLDEPGHPSNAQGDIDGAVSNPRPADVDDERLRRRVGPR